MTEMRVIGIDHGGVISVECHTRESTVEAKMSIDLIFDGYWPVPTPDVAQFSGIYCVYAWSDVPRLLYIGESKNVGGRVANHERQPDWERAADGDALFFSAAPVPAASRKLAEAAMIHEHQPPCNDEYVEDFPFDTTCVTATGKNEGLKSYFLVSED